MKNIPQQPWSRLLGLFAASCCIAAAQQAPPAAPELQQHQRELLQLAFDAASAFPLEPHGKNRSRAQEQVVVACFELGQPELALAYGTRIADWRRGVAYADFAWWSARQGDEKRAREYIGLARDVIAQEARNPTAQEWRADLVRLKVGRALAALGDQAEAAKLGPIDVTSTHAVDSSWASTAAERVASMTLEQAKAELAEIDLHFAAMSLGQQQTVLATLARLHGASFADAALRQDCEVRVAQYWTKMPPALRLDALATMVENHAAARRGDEARALLPAMREIVAGHQWRAEDRLPQVARLIELTAATGDVERARHEAERELEGWHAERDGIVDIWRAGALRPLALAWFAIGDADKAQDLLALVLEEGMENPNARPRCNDLVATCVALARRGIEPSPQNWQRMREIRGSLRDPW